jgi:hypothetical protein
MAVRAWTFLGLWQRIVLEVDTDFSEERILSITSFYLEDGDDILLWNVGVYFPDCTVSTFKGTILVPVILPHPREEPSIKRISSLLNLQSTLAQKN